MLTLQLLLAWACGFFDRIRGDAQDVLYSKTVEAVIYGLAVGAIVGFRELELLLFAVLWAVGASFGWGSPVGSALDGRDLDPHDLEQWQVGPLKTNIPLALTVRGLIWGACVAPLMYFNFNLIYLCLLMGMIFPTATYLGRYAPLRDIGGWTSMEYYRGWLVGLAAFTVSYCT